MREVFLAEMSELGDDLIGMGDQVRTAIESACEALLEADLELAQKVIAGDAAIDMAQREVDERAVTLLARQAPVARDLRTVVSALRMSSTLERMGDLARHVAEVARLRYPNRGVPDTTLPVFEKMTKAAIRASHQVCELLRTQDLELAARIIAEDDAIDLLHEQTFQAMLGTDWTGDVQAAVDVTLVGRYLERFGDHAVSVARRVTYLVEGDTAGLIDNERV
jgi:phosphate transport system protein